MFIFSHNPIRVFSLETFTLWLQKLNSEIEFVQIAFFLVMIYGSFDVFKIIPVCILSASLVYQSQDAGMSNLREKPCYTDFLHFL